MSQSLGPFTVRLELCRGFSYALKVLFLQAIPKVDTEIYIYAQANASNNSHPDLINNWI